MKNTVQKIISVMALSASLLSYTSAFAIAPDSDQVVSGRENLSWSIGVKTLTKGCFQVLVHRSASGVELAIDIFVGLKLSDKVSMQSGLICGYNDLYTAGYDAWKREVMDGWSLVHKPPTKTKSTVLLDVDKVTFYAISIPLSIRWYPGSGRQFALHGGPRLMIPISKVEQICCGYFILDQNSTFWDQFVDFIHGKSKNKASNKSLNEIALPSYLTFDFGFDYTFKSGFIIGMNGLGTQIGYDFTHLFTKQALAMPVDN
ncbi:MULTISPECIES: hypothetical protein [Candidatus Cardinium]|uniref:hypothetical protein n=1 Tax=Candidatus Cardinium TaxID=273135 RepID=UPI001FAB2F11|nr:MULTISPECIES: hypothetical protein [Cardinium]